MTELTSEEKIKVMVDALTFYAEGWHYRMRLDGDMELENGDKADEALVACGYPSTRDTKQGDTNEISE